MASSIMVKRIIIIGATSGIGYEVAKIYWKRGYQLGLAGRRVDRLEEFRRQDPEHIRIKQLDVTAEDAADRLEELIRDLGGMDIFLLSSGIGNQNKYLDTSIEQVTIQTNVTGFTRMVLAAYRYFSSQGGGHISVISSIAGTKGLGVAPSYSATKRYQNIYIDALAQLSRMEKQPITFTDIRPGFVDTALGQTYPIHFWLLTPDEAAADIYKAICKKKKIAYISGRWKWAAYMMRLIPVGVYCRMGKRLQ